MSPDGWQPLLADALRGWAVLAALGLAAAPFVLRAGAPLPAAGWYFLRPLALAPWALLSAWIARSGWIDPSRAHAVALGLLGVAGLALALRERRPLARLLHEHRRAILRAEAAWALAFLAFLCLRGFMPDAEYDGRAWYGAEKWPNLALLTSLQLRPAMPPEDPWLGGWPVNYYYLGHWAWAGLGRLAALPPERVFNLAQAASFAMLALTAWGLGRTLGRSAAAGAWALLLLLLAGPPAAWLQAPGFARVLLHEGPHAALLGFDFWAASDILPHTRSEFPAFHFLLGDLHAHGLSQTLLLCALALMAAIGRRRDWTGGRWRGLIACPGSGLGLLATMTACIWTAGGWDLAPLGLAALLWVLAESRSAARDPWTGRIDRPLARTQSLQGLLLIVLLFLLALGPLSHFYNEIVRPPLDQTHWATAARWPGPLAVAAHLAPLPAGQGSPLRLLALYFGLLLLPLALPPLLALFHLIISRQRPRIPAAIPALALPVWALWVLAGRPGGLAAWLAAWACAACVHRLLAPRAEPADPDHAERRRWTLLLAATGLGLIALAEWLYLDDPIGPPHERYNTAFKFHYAAWGLLALAAALRLATPPSRGTHRTLAVLLIVTGSLYPLLALPARLAQEADRRREAGGPATPTLDALAYLRHRPALADDYRLGLWMRKNLDHEPGGIATAPSGSYGPGGRIAILTARPEPLAWINHQAQWRGRLFSQALHPRRRAWLDQLYRATDPATVRHIADEQDLRWIVLGNLERQNYPESNFQGIQAATHSRHNEATSTLLEITPKNQTPPPQTSPPH